MAKYILLTLLFFLSLSYVSALQLTPSFTSIDFSSGVQKDISLSAVNDESKNFDFVIFAQGEMNSSFLLSDNKIFMTSSEGSKPILLSLKMPGSLEPGTHGADIVALETATGIRRYARIEVNVPYPAMYLKSNLSISGAIQNSTAQIKLNVNGMGADIVPGVNANIDIYNKFNEKVVSLNTDRQDVLPGQNTVLTSSWNVNVSVGEYKAISKILYDGKESVSENKFSVGSLFLEIQQIQVKSFSLGGIAKFEMLVQNNWDRKLSGVSVRTQVLDSENKVIGDFKSASYDIDSLKKADIVSYWDTSNVQAGEYTAKVSIDNGQTIQNEEFPVTVGDASIEISEMQSRVSQASGSRFFNTQTLIIVAGVLILANIAWVFIARKRLKNKK